AIRARAPAARFAFLVGDCGDARARALAAWGPVVTRGTPPDRLESALRHATLLATMAVEMRRLRDTRRFQRPRT
ncbi:MAG TPA: hypothetical protein VHB21_06455, partial [Minicystis sp.]|nr:hypothetical protein [Minicystis sp.]